MLGAEAGSALTYVLPGVVLLAAVIGLVWGYVIESSRPDVYDGIGGAASRTTPPACPGCPAFPGSPD